MMKRSEYLEHHFEPYMALERDFIDILDYVALRESNFSASSEKLLRVLECSCELIESLVKDFYFAPGEDAHYKKMAEALLADAEFDSDKKVSLLRGVVGYELRPFLGLDPNNALSWWKAHNDIKHNRAKYFESGNLGNALSALAALYYLNLLCVKKVGSYWDGRPDCENKGDIDVPNENSRVFSVHMKTRNIPVGFDTYLGISS